MRYNFSVSFGVFCTIWDKDPENPGILSKKPAAGGYSNRFNLNFCLKKAEWSISSSV